MEVQMNGIQNRGPQTKVQELPTTKRLVQVSTGLAGQRPSKYSGYR